MRTAVALPACLAAAACAAGVGPAVLAEGGEPGEAPYLARAAVRFNGEAGRGYERELARHLEARLAQELGLGAGATVAHGCDTAALLHGARALVQRGRTPARPACLPGGADRWVAVLLVWVWRPDDPRPRDEYPIPPLLDPLRAAARQPDGTERLAVLLLARVDGASGRVREARAAGTTARADRLDTLEALLQAVR
jgi:hypothetical protein